MKTFNERLIFSAFRELDKIVPDKINILIGGGAAILLHKLMPISTYDIDAIPFKSVVGPDDLKVYRDQIAKKLALPTDWINPYFHQFTHCLPPNYGQRLKKIFRGKNVICYLLHPMDIAIMKLFAGRGKDESHLKVLLKPNNVDLELIDTYLNEIAAKNHPGAKMALKLFNELVEAMGI